jgi:hypothetical protein
VAVEDGVVDPARQSAFGGFGEGGEALGVMRGFGRFVPFLDPAFGQEEMGGAFCGGQPVGDGLGQAAAFLGVEADAFDQAVVFVERAVLEARRDWLPAGEVQDVGGACGPRRSAGRPRR